MTLDRTAERYLGYHLVISERPAKHINVAAQPSLAVPQTRRLLTTARHSSLSHKMRLSVAFAASLIASAAAHATFQELLINGVDQGKLYIEKSGTSF